MGCSFVWRPNFGLTAEYRESDFVNWGLEASAIDKPVINGAIN